MEKSKFIVQDAGIENWLPMHQLVEGVRIFSFSASKKVRVSSNTQETPKNFQFIVFARGVVDGETKEVSIFLAEFLVNGTVLEVKKMYGLTDDELESVLSELRVVFSKFLSIQDPHLGDFNQVKKQIVSNLSNGEQKKHFRGDSS